MFMLTGLLASMLSSKPPLAVPKDSQLERVDTKTLKTKTTAIASPVILHSISKQESLVATLRPAIVSRPARWHQSKIKWPQGRYCIARYGSKCPDSAFTTGRIYWDDEDSNNNNRVSGQVLPSGSYGENTAIDFCCRDDGSVNANVLLPPNEELCAVPVSGSRLSEGPWNELA